MLNNIPPEAFHLGMLQQEYRGRNFYKLGLLALVLAPMLILLSVNFLQYVSLALSGFVGFLSIMLIPVGLMLLAYSLSNRRMRVLVFDRGFAYIQGRNPIIVDWNNVKDVRLHTIRNYFNFVYIGNNYKCSILLNNGSQITISDRIDGIRNLGETLAEAVNKRS